MQSAEQPKLWGFVDWGTERHSVCVVEEPGRAVAEFAVDNTPEGLSKMVVRLTERCQGARETMVIGIEVPHGPVVDALLDAGFAAFTLNPKQIDRFRDRYSPAGAKDDRRDAFVGANALRTDPNAFHRIDPEHAAVIELREWSRIDRDLGQDLVALANRLQAQVLRVAPHWLKLCPAANQRWFWALLELAPTPRDAAGLTTRRVQTVLRRHRIRRLSASQVHTVWQSSCLGTPAGVVSAVGAHVRTLLPQLQLLHAQRRESGAHLERCLKACQAVFRSQPDRPSDVEIVLSQPGIGIRVAASLFGEAGRILRQRNCQAFRVQSGTGPVTKASGKSTRVVMRRACQQRLRDACYHWARVAVIFDPRCKAHYAQLRAKGHGHARALRGVVDRQTDRLFAMLNQGTLHDPNHRRVPAAQKAVD